MSQPVRFTPETYFHALTWVMSLGHRRYGFKQAWKLAPYEASHDEIHEIHRIQMPGFMSFQVRFKGRPTPTLNCEKLPEGCAGETHDLAFSRFFGRLVLDYLPNASTAIFVLLMFAATFGLLWMRESADALVSSGTWAPTEQCDSGCLGLLVKTHFLLLVTTTISAMGIVFAPLFYLWRRKRVATLQIRSAVAVECALILATSCLATGKLFTNPLVSTGVQAIREKGQANGLTWAKMLTAPMAKRSPAQIQKP